MSASVATPPRVVAVEFAIPAKARRRPRALPWIVLAAAAGVALTSCADALSRTGHAGGAPMFWVAVGLILLPAAIRLGRASASSGERAATVVVVGLALYAVKVLRDPFAFTYADELVHLHNLQQIVTSGRLFGSNPILPLTPRYPGVESVAAAIVRAGGVSNFAAGVAVIAAARVVMMLALYLFYERASGSSRTAGLAALVYTAAPSFVFFSGQFSYESLALPLAVFTIFLLVRWMRAPSRGGRWRWGATFVFVAAAVVVTHHVTAYVLVAFLLAVCVLHKPLHVGRSAPWLLMGITGLLAAAWLVLVAAGTRNYLSPVISHAVSSVVDTLSHEAPTRTLFASPAGAEQTPLAERVAAIGGIGLLALAILRGVSLGWLGRRRDPILVLLKVAALAYLATLPLRLVPAAWETVSRASEFLFVGVGLTATLGIVWLLDRGGGGARRVLAAGAVTLVFASGLIAGWPSSMRLGQPLRVDIDGRTIEPPAEVAARWSGRTLGLAPRVAAQAADARLFLDLGHQTALAGTHPDIQDMLNSSALESWERTLLRLQRISLVVSDRRAVASDTIAGYFFDVRSPSLAPATTQTKFQLPVTNRLYDSGDLVIFGVRGLW